MRSVKDALATVDDIEIVKADSKDQSLVVKVPADFDVEAVLNKFQDDGHKHISGWKKADDDAAPADGDGAATSKKSGTQTVSLKLPGMT